MKDKYKKITLAPFCYSRLSINEMIRILLLCILPHVVMLVITQSYASISLFFLMIFVSICSELLHSLILRTGIKISWSTILQGALIGLLIPATYSPVTASIIALMVFFLEKVIFKNFAQFWLNPIIIIALVLYFIHPDLYPIFMLMPENVQFTNIGTRLFTDNLLSISELDTQISTFLNTHFLNTLNMQLPKGYFTLFFDAQTTIPAFRFNAITILSSIFLFSTKTLDYLIPTLFLIIYSALVYFFSLFPYANIIGSGDILLALFTSGTLFSTFFLITWFGTTPKTIYGKIIFAIIAGILAFLICGAGTSCVGMLFVILLLNILSPIIIHIESIIYDKKLRKHLDTAKIVRG